jgi:pyruvate dehydrogenase E2 component (dihydrolipoamide acetyltransferase)
MASYEFKLPDIGEGVAEGEIVKWLVSPGDIVKEDQPMVEVMTDKATVTITAPKSGRIAEMRGKEGQVVAVHSVLVVFDSCSTSAASRLHLLRLRRRVMGPRRRPWGTSRKTCLA